MKHLALPVLGVLLLTGAGCLDFPDELTASDLDLSVGANLHLAAKSFSLLPRASDGPYWELEIKSLAPGKELAGSWSKFEQQETEASVAARQAAENSGIGDNTSKMPAPIYEMIRTDGTFSTQALDAGTATTLPSFLKADYRGGNSNGIFWLSKKQYDELVTSRHTRLELSIYGSSLTNLLNAAGGLDDLLERFGGEAAPNIRLEDLTEVEADADWGSYTVKVNGDNKKLQVIKAHNRFINYVILANPDNPLVLQIEPEFFGLGAGLLANLGDFGELSGYKVTELNGFKPTAPTSEDQPQPQAQ